MGLENFPNSFPVQQLPRKDNGSVEESDNEQTEQRTKFHESENFDWQYLMTMETLILNYMDRKNWIKTQISLLVLSSIIDPCNLFRR